jgi:hypothetical protein
MADDLDNIRRFVGRLVWRERALLLLDVAGRALLLVFATLLLVVVAAMLDWDRGGTAAVLVLLGGAGSWAAVVVPLLLRWRQTGDALRQARLAEADNPELRGRLVTAVERTGGPTEGESELMLGLLARRAVAELPNTRPSRIHRGIRQVVVAAASTVLLLLPVVMSLFAGGPFEVARWWAEGFDAQAAVAALEREDAAAEAQVGDLVIRYTYPDYTGLESRVVENSTGDAQGPPGTRVEVTARSAERIDAAGLVAYDERLDAQVTDARMVTGSFTIGTADGTYRLVTWRGGDGEETRADEARQESRDFQITANEDLAPEVMLDTEKEELQLAVDEDFQLIWRARDDYGIQSVAIQVDGARVGSPVYRMEERRAEVYGDDWRTPAALGLAPGDEVELTVAAWDNDTFSGSKMGSSRPVRLVVLGPRGLEQRSDQQLENIVSAMLSVLADHLEEPFPIGSTNKDFAAWGEALAKRYQPLNDIVDSEWSRLPEESVERTVLADAIDAGGELVRYTAVAFDPRSNEMAQPAAVSDTEEYRDDAISSLENGILALDRMLRNRALREVVETTEKMEEIGRELEELMSQDDPDALAMLAKLEQLEAMMQQLAEQSAKLSEGGLKEFVNARSNEMKDLMSEIRKAIQEGRMDDAKKMMERLAQQLQQMAEGVRDTMERQQGESSDAMQQAEDLKAELEQLEQEQRDLQEQVEQLREEADQDQAEEANAIWEEIQAEATALSGELSTYHDALEPALRSFTEQQRAEAARLQAARLLEAAMAQDLRGSRTGHRSTSISVDSMYRALQSAKMSGGARRGPGRKALDSMYAHLDRIQELLDQLEQQPPSSATQQQTQQLEQQQQQLQERLQEARQKAEQLSQQFEVQPEKMGESLEQADQRMDDARQDLKNGQPMPAEGSQGAAAERIREARESLEKAMEQAQQMQQQMQPRQGQQQRRDGNEQSRGEESGKDNDNRPNEIEIPGAEDFQTPEEYRRALLEGMEGEVPEEYRQMKKRYFEELVRQ